MLALVLSTTARIKQQDSQDFRLALIMFRILPPAPVPSTSNYHATHDEGPAQARDLMDVDEDPAFPSGSTSRIAIPGEPVASAQEWMRCTEDDLAHGLLVS